MHPLEIAIQMEMDGKGFYLEASENASDSLGKELFSQLSAEEDLHARKATQIYERLKLGDKSSEVDIGFDQGKAIKSIFAKASEHLRTETYAATDVLEAIRLALEIEETSRMFYEEHSGKSSDGIEKQFFSALMAEERGHYLALQDYHEYLVNPAGWFVEKEHPSLNGG